MSTPAQRRLPVLIRDERGFTLVEVLVAAALFLGVFMTLATLFAQATTGFTGTRLITASTLAQSAMEEAINARFQESIRRTERSNQVLWEIDRTVERVSDRLIDVRVTVTRASDSKVYASLWTQLYRPIAP